MRGVVAARSCRCFALPLLCAERSAGPGAAPASAAFHGGMNASRSRDRPRAQRFAQAAGVTAARRDGAGGGWGLGAA